MLDQCRIVNDVVSGQVLKVEVLVLPSEINLVNIAADYNVFAEVSFSA